MPAHRIKIYLPLIFSFTFYCCHSTDAPPPNELQKDGGMVFHADSIARDLRFRVTTADLILRAGRDFSSEQVKELSPDDKTYSHGGIAVREKDEVYIYHVEPDYYYQKDKVRKEPLDSFIDHRHNEGFALARYSMDSLERTKFITFLEDKYRKQIPFDMSFDLASDDKMYCSEMIKKGLEAATNRRILIEPIPLNDRSKYKQIKQYFKMEEREFAQRPILPIDRLFLHPSCTIIQRYEYLR